MTVYIFNNKLITEVNVISLIRFVAAAGSHKLLRVFICEMFTTVHIYSNLTFEFILSL